MRLFLTRHGQTAWNAEERAQGHTDIPLDATGIRQSEQLAAAFSQVPVELLLSSDLSRSAETARAVARATGAPVEEVVSLRERAFGEWEGLLYTDFLRLSQATHSMSGAPIASHDVRPPGGESLQDAWDRISPVAQRLRTCSGTTLVIAHGGVCSILMAQLFDGSLATTRAFRFSNCSVTELLRRPDGSFQLLRFNDASHLYDQDPVSHAASR